MKPYLSLMLAAAMLPLLFSACATTEPENLESSLRKQDQKIKKMAERSRTKALEREQKWNDYTRRSDARYDQWVDSVLD
ncbi:MAG: hypothetical protein ABL994_17830 [Verrucomicrobiales bacterium]